MPTCMAERTHTHNHVGGYIGMVGHWKSPNYQSTQDGRRICTMRAMRDIEMDNPHRRVVLLLDMDCFYAQCESIRLGLDQKIPLALIQWRSARKCL